MSSDISEHGVYLRKHFLSIFLISTIIKRKIATKSLDFVRSSRYNYDQTTI